MFIPADRLIRRDFKPDFPVRLNRDHPLAPYLSALWLPSTLNPVDLATGQSGWTATGTINPSISRSGRAVKGNGLTGYLSRSISVSNLAPHLMLAVFEAAVVSATPKTIYSLGSAAGGSAAYIRICNGSDTTTPIMAQIRSVDNSANIHNVTGPTPVAGGLYACAWHVASTASADSRLWVNGAAYSATGGTLETFGSGTFVHEAIGVLKRGTLIHYSPDHILLIARGIPALGANLDAVLREWTLNPWGLLEPEQSRAVVIFPAASGGTTLTIADALHAHVADNFALTQAHTLALNDASHGHTADNLAMTQAHLLALADAAHSHTADNLALIQNFTLAVSDAAHGHTADNLALTQIHTLAVADALHGHVADNLTLEAAGTLAIQDATHAHTTDNLDLTQLHLLAVADASHGHAADNLDLSQVHLLVVADAAHALISDNVTLDTATMLTVQDALHAHSVDQLTLTQVHALIVQDAGHDHTADNLTLTTAATLAIQEAAHAHAADNLALVQNSTLVITDALHAHAAGNLALTQAQLLAIQDALHGHLADHLALGQNHILIVSDALHTHLAALCNVYEGLIDVPSERTVLVLGRDRTIVVMAADRSVLIH
jgi:hypothetical protein